MSRARDISKFASQIDSTGVIIDNTLETVIDQDYIATYSTASASSGATVYNRFDSIPTSGLSAGDLAFIDSSNKHYIFSGEGWYLINYPENIAPSFTGLQDSYSFNFGDSAFDITLTGSDSNTLDRVLTFSFSGDNSLDSAASISQSDNVFTVTPDADSDGDTIESTVTFSLTDGRSITSSSTLFRAVSSQPQIAYTYLWTPDGTFGDDTGVTVTSSGLSTLTSGIASQTVSGKMTEVSASGDYLRIQYSNTDFTRESGKYKFVWAWNVPSYDASLRAGLTVRDEDGRIVSFSTESSSQMAVFQGTTTTSRLMSPTMGTSNWYIMTAGSSYNVASLLAAKVPGGSAYTVATSSNRGYAHGYATNNNEFIMYSSTAAGGIISGFNRAVLTQYLAGVAIYPTTMTDEEMLDDFDTAVFGN